LAVAAGAVANFVEVGDFVHYQQVGDSVGTGKAPLLAHLGEHVESLPKGVGLWKVGNRSFIVANRVTTDELAVFGTDDRMI
jgi:hypothetical protein